MKEILISLIILVLTSTMLIAKPLDKGPIGQGGTDQGSVAITGGSIDGTPIGSSTPSTGTFTNLSATGTLGGRLNRFFSSLPITTGEAQRTLTEDEILNNFTITNQGGGAAETDIKLLALSYEVTLCFEDQEGQGFEVCPETDGYIRIDGGAAEAANTCAILTAGAGYKFYVKRTQDTDGTWYYQVSSHTGLVSFGAAD